MEKKLSYKSLELHIKNMRGCGLYHLSTDAPTTQKFFQTLYMRWVLFFISVYTVQQILKVYEVRDNADKVMNTMFLLLTNTDSMYKQIILWIRADQIDELLDIMKGPLFNQGEPAHEELLTRTVRRARFALLGFNYAALATCFLWVLYPFILHLQGKQIELAIWLPFDANRNPHFYITIMYVWVQTSWLAFNNTSMDVFISFLLGQSKTQLSILRLDLENLVKRSKEEARVTSMPLSNIIHKRFKKIILHYNEIISFTDKTLKIFGDAVQYFFIICGWIICTSAYRMVNISPTSMDFVSMTMYLICIEIEIFLYCYNGNEVYYESQRLIESICASEWLETTLSHRKNLIIFMERIKRPIIPRAGTFVSLSAGTIVSILRSSYSFYAFLKNSKS